MTEVTEKLVGCRADTVREEAQVKPAVQGNQTKTLKRIDGDLSQTLRNLLHYPVFRVILAYI